MKLYEFQAKKVFAQGGIPVPRGEVVQDPESAAKVAEQLGRVVVKAQVHVGGRGKAGGIKLANSPSEARQYAEGMLGKPLKGFTVSYALVEEALNIASEYYLGITVDRNAEKPIVMLSRMGGVDIEEVAATQPQAIAKMHVDPAWGLWDFQLRDLVERAELDPRVSRDVVGLIRKLYGVFSTSDASLAEINPLVVTGDGKVIAADGKFDVDDNALFRQKELLKYREVSEADPIEAEAARKGVAYVRLDGDIGVIGNGAGLVMTTLDILSRNGGKAANFCDLGGGAKAETVRQDLELVLMNPRVKGVLFNIFGGIVRCDEVAKGIIEATRTMDIKVPIVIRMSGTRAAEGRELLKGTNLIPAATAQEAAKKIIELVKNR
ncbi:MAG: ADP-forming succinate--CoA ligase subunit beta [Chloroflexi bacterium]|nr:ADP-forming succinate--CoA ligase subunit beta [Chloroflexota bacterium]